MKCPTCNGTGEVPNPKPKTDFLSGIFVSIHDIVADVPVIVKESEDTQHDPDTKSK